MSYIEFDDVKKIYKMGDVKIKALNGASFTIDKGEFAVIAGASGAGKSTIFKLLLGLYNPQKGSILINDMNSAAIPDNRKRKIFGYVEQSFHIVPGTVKDQITLYDKSISDEADGKIPDPAVCAGGQKRYPGGLEFRHFQGQWRVCDRCPPG